MCKPWKRNGQNNSIKQKSWQERKAKITEKEQLKQIE